MKRRAFITLLGGAAVLILVMSPKR